MRKTTLKIWLGIGTVALMNAGLDVASAAAAEAQKPHAHAHAAGQGGDGGEGGEEGHGDTFADAPAGQALVGRLLMLKGHLMVGRELYEAGRKDDALPHYLHPAEEIYGSIQGELKRRKLAAFSRDLKQLSALVKKKAPAEEVFAKQAEVVAKADKALAAAWGTQPAFVMEVLPRVLAQAADEYKEAFEGARIANVVEYQDARGFVMAAQEYVKANADALKAKDAAAEAKVEEGVNGLAAAFPAAVPPQQPTVTAADFQTGVSKVELLKSSFR